MKTHEPNRRSWRHALVGVALAGVATVAMGCATDPTPRLQAARATYDLAQSSAASRLAPKKVYEAKKALDRAEVAHDEEPGSLLEEHLAYIAQRKAEQAIGHAALVEARQQLFALNEQFDDLNQAADRVRLAVTRRDLAEAQRQAVAGREEASRLEGELQTSRAEKEAAERLAIQAMNELAQVAKVERNGDETVISLSGSVLFGFGESTLLEPAKRALERVAESLKKYGEDQVFVIEGHTDSVGSDETNQQLSMARARAVRDFLVERGVPEAKLKVVGRGEAEPLTTNDTPEGRAVNRRVEIIIPD